MMAWWTLREPRERMMIIAAGIVLVFVLVVQFLVLPIARANAEAHDRNASAARTLDTVLKGVSVERARLQSGGQAEDGTLSGDALRGAVMALAQERGVSVSRIQNAGDGRFSLSMDSVEARIFFTWLSQTRALFGAQVAGASVSQAADGTVRAVVEFEGGRG